MTVRTGTADEAAAALLRGLPVVFPTDTVYGLGVAVGATDGPQALYDLKRRDRGKPIAWLVGSVSDLDRFGKAVPESARRLARAFWPGPLTLVVAAGDQVPPAFRSAEGTIGLRMPDNAAALGLIRAVGSPLATTSANRSGCAAPCSFDAIDPQLAAGAGAVLADADDEGKSGVASTVLDCTSGRPAVVRAGGIAHADIQALL